MERKTLWLIKHLAIMLRKKYFNIRKPMQTKAEFLVLDTPVRPVSETGLTAQIGLTGPEPDLTGDAAVDSNSARKDDSINAAEAQDWRVPLISYLRDPGHGAERNIRCLAFKYVLIDDELYRRTAEDLLLKCLDSDQAKLLWVRFMRAFVVLINRLPR